VQYLLDTHILLWYLYDNDELPFKVKNMLDDANNTIYYSPINLLEIAIKLKKNKDFLSDDCEEIRNACLENGFEPLPYFDKHVFSFEKIRKKDNTPKHQDPFDLMLLSQAKRSKNIKLLTHDHCFEYYDEDCILLV